jgi:hypothetical protein
MDQLESAVLAWLEQQGRTYALVMSCIEKLQAERDEARRLAIDSIECLEKYGVKYSQRDSVSWLAETPSENAPVSAVDDQQDASGSEAVSLPAPAN